MSTTWIPVTETLPAPEKVVLITCIEVGHTTPQIFMALHTPPFTLLAEDTPYCYAEDWGEYRAEDDEYYCPEGWYEFNQNDDYYMHIQGTITHWMPLPDPPIEITGRDSL